MEKLYSLLFIYEDTMLMLYLYITYILVLKPMILVLYQWYQFKDCRLGKLTEVKANDLSLFS